MSITSINHVLSPAKLNLFLHIVGQRPDSYHLLQSIFVAIDWFDKLHFRRTNNGHLTRQDLKAALPKQDLTLRAAQLLQHHSKTSFGVHIGIEKNIPIQAGLGGGSSNAATTLLALNQLWELHLDILELKDLAARLGADVPFFLHNGPAWVEGIGEIISEIKLPKNLFKTPIAVLKPKNGVSTQQIFNSPLLTKTTKPITIADFASFEKRLNQEQLTEQDLFAVFEFGQNDLQEAAIANEPQIAQALQWLEQLTGTQARMSGSGSAVFAALKKEVDLLEQSTNLLPLGWQFKMCRILGVHPHSHWLSG